MVKKSEIIYFNEIKEENTDKLLEAVKKYQEESGIKHIVISSDSGLSALKLSKLLNNPEINIVDVTLHSGFRGGDTTSWNEKYKEELIQRGVQCHMGTHALSGINRGMSKKFGGFNPAELVAETYRTISVGLKVAVEVSIMAADAGLVPTDEEIIAIGGHSTKGVDTAIVLNTAHMNNVFDLSIHEIIAITRD